MKLINKILRRQNEKMNLKLHLPSNLWYKTIEFTTLSKIYGGKGVIYGMAKHKKNKVSPYHIWLWYGGRHTSPCQMSAPAVDASEVRLFTHPFVPLSYFIGFSGVDWLNLRPIWSTERCNWKQHFRLYSQN